MWLTTVIVIVIAGYFYYQIDRRIKNLEKERNSGYSYSMSIDAVQSVLKFDKFGELCGIASATEGKEFKDWTKTDKDKLKSSNSDFRKFRLRSRVNLTYLSSENAYFINSYQGCGIIFRDQTTNLLYSATVAGDDDGLENHILFSIYEKLVKSPQGIYEWMLLPCLEYRDEDNSNEKNKFITLCEFPHFARNIDDDDFRNLGFIVDRREGLDFFKNVFGEEEVLPTIIKYKKNGVDISFSY